MPPLGAISLSHIFSPGRTQTHVCMTLKTNLDKNLSVSLSSTSTENKVVERYIEIKTHKFIILKFFIKNNVNILYD